MHLNKKTHLLIIIIIVFFVGYAIGQFNHQVIWLWKMAMVVEKENGRIKLDIADNVQIGLRSDGVVVWRYITEDKNNENDN